MAQLKEGAGSLSERRRNKNKRFRAYYRSLKKTVVRQVLFHRILSARCKVFGRTNNLIHLAEVGKTSRLSKGRGIFDSLIFGSCLAAVTNSKTAIILTAKSNPNPPFIGFLEQTT